ncbi:hypothetical protein GEMRC1_003643 [Eukaryota sp. GEM-RC1]
MITSSEVLLHVDNNLNLPLNPLYHRYCVEVKPKWLSVSPENNTSSCFFCLLHNSETHFCPLKLSNISHLDSAISDLLNHPRNNLKFFINGHPSHSLSFTRPQQHSLLYSLFSRSQEFFQRLASLQSKLDQVGILSFRDYFANQEPSLEDLHNLMGDIGLNDWLDSESQSEFSQLARMYSLAMTLRDLSVYFCFYYPMTTDSSNSFDFTSFDFHIHVADTDPKCLCRVNKWLTRWDSICDEDPCSSCARSSSMEVNTSAV